MSIRGVFRAVKKKMEEKGLVRCRADSTHTKFKTHTGKCVCGEGLSRTCPTCGKVSSYGHFRAHKCNAQPLLPPPLQQVLPLQPPPPPPLLQPPPAPALFPEAPPPAGPQRLIRFAYWASDWELNSLRNKKAFRIAPRGQLREDLPMGMPELHGFRVHAVKDRSERGQLWMDAYDAVFARISLDTDAFRLVKVYHTWAEVLTALEDPIKAFKDLDVLVLGNWVHQVTTDQLPLDWLERLRVVEVQTGCRIFPPLDYSVTFARKELVMRLVERCATPLAKHIPTKAIFDGQWREEFDEFTQEHSDVVVKRSISETHNHVQFVKTTKLRTFKFGALPWLIQHVIPEFEEHNELRLYVVRGRFLWGVSSSFQDGDLALFPFAPGRIEGDWDPAAIKVAELLVATLAQHVPDAAQFLRIDMVRCNAGGWYINELEFFGNAHLHLGVADDGHQILPALVDCVKEWMRI